MTKQDPVLTAPIIGHHLALDPLVMRRSGVRIPAAAHYST
jgi:hypothetical protein